MKNAVSILIIDDSDIDRMIVRSHLKHVFDKVSIEEAREGEEALSFLENSQDKFPGLILVDINMPILNGFQFLEKYETVFWKQHPQTLVFILSSSNAEADIEKAKEFASVKGFMTKPLKREQVKSLYNLLLHPNQTNHGTSPS